MVVGFVSTPDLLLNRLVAILEFIHNLYFNINNLMGFVFSKILSAFASKTDEEVKIVMIGLNNAGKTTILYKMNIGEVI